MDSNKRIFPDVETANEDGIVAIGGSLTTPLLKEAYLSGIFPWPIGSSDDERDYPLTWFSPDPRGILEFKNFKISKSLKKFLKKSPYSLAFNQDFEKIITNCSHAKRKGQSSSWIDEEIIKGYQELFKLKLAYCVGVYLDSKLVGGLYGVCIGEVISGESMFHFKDNASKQALVGLVHKLQANGIEWIDTQMVTPLLESFGAHSIPRFQFMRKLKELNTKAKRDDIF